MIFVAGYRPRLREKRQLKAAFEQGCHIGFERAVPVFDAYSSPLKPEWKFVEIAIDRIMQAAAFLILDPSLRRAGRGKARQICNQQSAGRFQPVSFRGWPS